MLLPQLLIDGARRAPDDAALHWVGGDGGDRDRVLTYAAAAEAMQRAAGALASLGVARGDRVAIVAPNSLEYVVAMFGLWRLGAIAALVSVAYAEQLDYYLRDCDPSVLLYGAGGRPAIDQHQGAAPSLRHLVCLDGTDDGAWDWAYLVARAGDVPSLVDLGVEEGDVAHLSYTSGTSGAPKGACLAHEPTARATRTIAERLRLERSDVSYGPTALSSSYQLVANLLPALHRGAEVCVAASWPGGGAGWNDVARVGATVVAANPVVLTDLLAASRERGRAPAGLRLGLSGGGPVPPLLKRAWRDELGVTLAESFGQSELGGFFGLGGADPLPDRLLDACGPPLPDKEVRIFDEHDQDVAVGELGEIVLRGGFMVGYWRRPEKTAETLRGGWLHSGDVGFLDRDGYLHMRGRLSERLTVAGEHCYPRDVEEALLRHPAVTAAAVIGVPDSELGQRPVAYVTVVGTVAEADLVAVVTDAPSGLEVRIVESLPMTPTGKISKAQLRDRYA